MKSLEVTATWNRAFFEDFVAFRQSLYRAHPWALDERLSDLEKLWGPQSPLGREFRAYLLRDSSGQIHARALVSVARAGAQFTALGFYERSDAASGVDLLARIDADLASQASFRAQGDQRLRLRAPMQGHFFNSYRLVIEANEKPFFGEPTFPKDYADDFRRAGFETAGQWRTVEIRKDQAQLAFDRIWKATEPRWNRSGVRVRPLDLKQWPDELRRLYDLLSETFNQMPNYEPLAWPAFELLFRDLSYLLDPRLVLFAEKDGQTEGFVIAVKDALPVLLRLQKRLRGWPWLAKVFKLQALSELKRHHGRLLVLYIGKKPSSALPWLGAALGKKITDEGVRQGYESAYICYLAEKSPIFTSLPGDLREVSRYALFEKDLPV